MKDPVAYADFRVRVAAYLIDAILLIAITAPILYAVYGPEYFESEERVYGAMDLVLSWFFPAIVVLAFWWMKSATSGKMAFSAIIVDARTGARPSFFQYVLRYDA